MKRILIGLVLTGLGLFFSILTVKALYQYKNSEDILPTAIYVGDGALLPENEGRLLIVTGTLTPVKYVSDSDLGLHLDTVGVKRVTERLVLQKNTADGDQFIWSHILEGSDMYSPDSRDITGEAKIGDIMLSSKLITLLPMTDSSYYSDFDTAELDSIGWELVMSEGYQYYITQAPARYTWRSSYMKNVKYSEWKYEGMVRAHYMYVDNRPTELTVIGVQRGNHLEYEPKVMTSVIEGKKTMEEVLKDNHRSSVFGTIAALVISFGLTIPGLFTLFPEQMACLWELICEGAKKLAARVKKLFASIKENLMHNG